MTSDDLPNPPSTFRCRQCGGELAFAPGEDQLTCPYCGTANAIEVSDQSIEELDYLTSLAEAADARETEERLAITCAACGAQSSLESDVTSGECPFCGTNVVLTGHSTRLIKPRALLPFAVDRSRALKAFRSWVASRWFAPNALKRLASTAKGIVGVYIPFWTYDCRSRSAYRGERGDEVSDTGGRRKTGGDRDIRWTPVTGTVIRGFDDIVVAGSESVPQKHVDRLAPWNLEELVPYSDDYLAGFRAESYRLDLAQGFERARKHIDRVIADEVRRDIGGDRQRVHSVSTTCSDITFKHILLPIWISAYRFNGKVFRFLVNARSGEVQGDRPYSWIKIALAILAGLTAIGALIASC